MSILSNISGIHISKKGVHIEPLKALATAATVGSFGGFGPLAGIAGKVGSVASKIPGAAKVAGVVNTLGKSKLGVAARTLNGGKAITLKNTLEGAKKNATKFGVDAFGALKKNPLEYAGAAAAGLNAKRAFDSAGQYQDKAVKTAEQSYNERAPLRKLGVAGMSKSTAQAPQDFVNSANPFARKRKVTL